MLGLSGNSRIFLYNEPINMHKNFEGLLNIVENIFQKDLMTNNYFVFINKRRTLMKVLYWDNDGIAIWYKRLEKGSFVKNKKSLMNRREFFLLLEGITPKKFHARFS